MQENIKKPRARPMWLTLMWERSISIAIWLWPRFPYIQNAKQKDHLRSHHDCVRRCRKSWG
jgi:hypothetical protein